MNYSGWVIILYIRNRAKYTKMEKYLHDCTNVYSQFRMSDMKTARPRIPSPLTGAMMILFDVDAFYQYCAASVRNAWDDSTDRGISPSVKFCTLDGLFCRFNSIVTGRGGSAYNGNHAHFAYTDRLAPHYTAPLQYAEYAAIIAPCVSG